MTTPRATAPQPLPDGLVEYVERRTGLLFPETRRETLAIGVRRVMSEAGVSDSDDMLERLEHDAALMDELVAAITIGETYFFRHPEQCALLRDQVLPGLAAAIMDRPIRIWSAACATGEEPYTLAMLCADLGLGTRVKILATDISRGALTTAAHGVYRRWSFRGVGEDQIERHFRRRGAQFELDPGVRSLVTFRYLNLAEDVYPSLASGIWGMDLVLCRNVLIYFGPAASARVARGLVASLSEPGCLLLGGSDPMVTEWVRCRATITPAGLIYHRGGARAAVPAEPAVAARAPARPADPVLPSDTTPASGTDRPAADIAAATPATDSSRLAAESYAARDYERAALAASWAVQRDGTDLGAWLTLVRALANTGRMADADRACLAGLERHPVAPELHCVHAVLLAAGDRHENSGEAARRALYLDRGYVAAHWLLGTALARTGDVAGARRALARAEELLGAMPPHRPVPGTDGEPAGRMLVLARTQRDLLGTTRA